MTDDPLEGITIDVGDYLHLWTLNIEGPKDSPYEGGVFKVKLELESYPFKMPEVTFITSIYHPNVSFGDICCCFCRKLGKDDW